MKRSNRVFTAHSDTPSYQVHIGIDQGEVVSPLLWVIYIDHLLTMLKKKMIDPYILRSSSLLSTATVNTSNLAINNLVFMDDSTLISSSKAGLEHMLSITEEFYTLNNTSANHQKYVLISNTLPLTITTTISPVNFTLKLSTLNRISSLSVTPISITSSFQFLGVWFNIKGSCDFVKKQIAGKCNSFTATFRLARLSAKQVVSFITTFLIPVSPLMVNDWSLWSNMNTFKCDYLACTIASMVSTPFRMQHARFTSSLPDLTLSGHTPLYSCMTLKVFKACLNILRKCHLYYLSQLITPSGSHLISWAAYQTAYIARLADKCGRSLPHKWYLDIKTNTTLPDSHDHLYDHYICSLSTTSAIDLVPDATITIQPKKDTCVIVHWISDCLSSSGDVIRLHPCPGCDAHIPFPAANKYSAVTSSCTFTISLLKSLILLTNCECIRQLTTEVVSSYSWADLCDIVISYYRRLNISPDFSSPSSIVNGNSIGTSPLCDLFCLPSPVILLPGSHYHYYTDGFLINLGSPEVLMGWSWVQIVHDAGYLNSVATYALDTIRNWPSSTKAEAAAIYATLCVSSDDSTISIYTDSQAAIDGLHLCVSSTYTNSHLYYKTTNFELWASIERSIHEKRLTILPVKVKGYDGNYWNELADSLANSAHHSESASLLPVADYTSSHNVCLVYNDVVCESNPRRLIKTYYQATFMKDLLALKRFQFTFCLCNRNDYMIDWKLTWFTLNFSLIHDASFHAHHASKHYTFKFKLFLDDLPLLKKLKITRFDLYIDLLTCCSCRDREEDLMHLILCSKRRTVMHQILQSYQNHLFSKLCEAGDLADTDPTLMLRKLSSLSCWTVSSANWSSYALIQGCLPRIFIDLFVDLSIPRPSAIKVVAAIYNNFIQKLRTHIWNLHTYDKCIWEDAMNITLKLKTTSRPSNLPTTLYVPFSSLPPPTHLVTSRDSRTDWIKNSMT
ncbi:hypothetical protein RclHR1_26930001 [Rhizophagus clarus]|uniref:Reverse transcriptase domain-containing protein n=1 Tax=Rhizophagus clarus TaxID=94130 RepID=A0A2Z6R1R0_9GLOM|nr:hypothetical protein RclHR1_26930001 [Rhizophagus clarus]